MANPNPKAPAAPVKEPKSFAQNLSGPKGDSLRFSAVRRPDGSIDAFVTLFVRDEKGKVLKSERGASSKHRNFTAAREWVDAGVERALKAGWKRRKGGGGRSKPDAFTLDNLPKPAK